MKNLFYSLILCLLGYSCLAQTPIIASLESQLQKATLSSDSTISIYHQLTRLYIGIDDYPQAIRATQKEIFLLENNNKKALKLAAAYFNLASINRILSNYKIALFFAQKSLVVYRKKLGVNDLEVASVERFIAQIYHLKNDNKSH